MVSRVASRPRYVEGQVVVHPRRGYRGVVIAVDAQCQAPSVWRIGIQSPSVDQGPWYHVLVDGGTHSTYLSETSLQPGTGSVDHPDVDVYFAGPVEEDGDRYARNEVPWELPW